MTQRDRTTTTDGTTTGAPAAHEVKAGRGASRGRRGVAAVAGATFTVVTSEMLPVGLLTPLGEALEVTEGTAGLTLTITGLVGAVSAPLLTPLAARFDRRTVLCALMAVLAVGNLLAAGAPDFAVMVAARVLVGIGMGGVWTIAAGLAVRLVPAGSVGTATASIFSGIAVASVLGVPAGTWLGGLLGWRAAFAAMAALSLVVVAALALLLPALPAEPGVRSGGVPRLLRQARVRAGLAVVALLVTGHFAAYTYVRPALEELSGADAGTIGTLLAVYGVAGVVGNFAAGAGVGRSPRATLVVIGAVLAGSIALVPALGRTVPVAAVLLVLWGLSYGGVSVAAQSRLMAPASTSTSASAPGDREALSALFVGVFNAAIALGALLGGLASDGAGVSAALWLGGGLAAAALAVTVPHRAP
ncbi:MFS transporter [Streptomyces sp. NPDC048606]|uniref:MFS transporter n=1 Tax=Streptomyces sp. NPDC048606 TaxID=3154726 RepID=UPI0034193F22